MPPTLDWPGASERPNLPALSASQQTLLIPKAKSTSSVPGTQDTGETQSLTAPQRVLNLGFPVPVQRLWAGGWGVALPEENRTFLISSLQKSIFVDALLSWACYNSTAVCVYNLGVKIPMLGTQDQNFFPDRYASTSLETRGPARKCTMPTQWEKGQEWSFRHS